MERPCVRVDREQGEETRRWLDTADLLDRRYEIAATDEWIYIPVTEPGRVPDRLEVAYHAVQSRDTRTLPSDHLEFSPTYERLGDLVLLDEPDPDRARAAAEAFLASDLPVKTVLNKASKVKGEQRVRDWEVLAGNGTETVHREYGCEFLVDVGRVYFSPRLARERHRVIEQVREGERVFDMFAGVGPFAIPMARRGAEVVATDLNPAAVEYLRQNATRNEVDHLVTAIFGDVREHAPEYTGWADRIVMNLPHSAQQFLGTAVDIAGDDCLVHYYDIQSEDDPFGPGEEAIRAAAEPGYQVSIEAQQLVRSYAPHELNVRLDARLHHRSNRNP